MTSRTLARAAVWTATLLVGCSGAEETNSPLTSSADPVDTPLKGSDADMVSKFHDGDGVFELPMRSADGLGPLYIRHACADCHETGVRGPGLVQKMSIVEKDGVTAAADQSALTYGHTVRPFVTAGATTPILPPEVDSLKVSVRVGPPVIGRGYMEAVLDSEIERMEAEQKTRDDGIHGRINRVTYASEANPDPTFNAHQKGETGLIGRFGLKARIATLDEFTADAFQGDMGMTSPMRPTEPLNPDGLTDDDKPGVDLAIDSVNQAAFYMRALEIPKRADDAAGAALFAGARCDVCHAPALKTRADYPIALLADKTVAVYTDFLLHDLGPDLADGMTDGVAKGGDWRTAPLIGLRHSATFMHDGRATSIEDAILDHAGEATDSVKRFSALSAADRDALIRFVGSL
ncbi:MAG: di-heme oxidoredictase family protein [Polyangiaceae bacterium]